MRTTILFLTALFVFAGVMALTPARSAYAFGEIYQIMGSATNFHFEGGSFTPAPTTKVKGAIASAFITANLDPGGKAYLRFVDATTMHVDVNPSFPDPQIYKGLMSSNGDFMMFTNDDGRAVQIVGKISFRKGTNVVLGVKKAAALILSGPLASPANFDHFAVARIKTGKTQITPP